MKKSLIPLFLVLLMAWGCNGKKAIIPVDPDVAPVTTPTLYRYAPFQGKMLLTVEAKDLAKDTHIFESCTIDFEGEERDGELFWTTLLTKKVEGDKTIEPALPIVKITARSDKRGIAQVIDVSSPWQRSMPNGEQREKELLETLNFELNEFLWPMSEEPIVTGQILTQFGEAKITEGSFSRSKTKLKMRLEGEKVADGVTYVTAQLDDKVTRVVQGQRLIVTLKGHSMLEKRTMKPVKTFIAMTYTVSGKDIAIMSMSLIESE